MKTLTHSPETNSHESALPEWERQLLDEWDKQQAGLSPDTDSSELQALATLHDSKDVRRHNYEVRHKRTQDHGTRGMEHAKDYYGKMGTDIREADLDRITADEQLSEVLDALSPTQLEKAANGILRASGFEIADAYAMNELFDDENAIELADQDPDSAYFYGDPEASNSYAENNDALRAEFAAMFDRGNAVRADADHTYEGTIDEGHADYLSGFHITDRP